jgi:hypothetical protein
MKKYLLNIRMMRFFFCIILFNSVLFFRAQAEQAEVLNFSGTAEVLLKDTEEYTQAQEGMVLEAGDKIRTESASSAELSFNDENTNLVRLNDDTSVEITLSGDEKLQMSEGEIFSSISALPSGSSFEIRTPTAVSGARGTDWVTKVTEEGTDVEALDSTPYVRHFESDGKLSQQITPINTGQMTTVRKFQKPMSFRPIPAERRQQWQQVKQGVRQRAGEAAFRRQQRPPFNRNEFLKRLKEQKGPNKSTFDSSPPGQRQQDKKEVEGPKTLISREGERQVPKEEAYRKKENDQRQPRGESDRERPENFSDRKPLSPRPAEDRRPGEQKVKPPEPKKSVGGQSSVPKASKGGGRRR